MRKMKKVSHQCSSTSQTHESKRTNHHARTRDHPPYFQKHGEREEPHKTSLAKPLITNAGLCPSPSSRKAQGPRCRVLSSSGRSAAVARGTHGCLSTADHTSFVRRLRSFRCGALNRHCGDTTVIHRRRTPMQEFLSRLQIDQKFASTEKEQRFIQSRKIRPHDETSNQPTSLA